MGPSSAESLKDGVWKTIRASLQEEGIDIVHITSPSHPFILLSSSPTEQQASVFRDLHEEQLLRCDESTGKVLKIRECRQSMVPDDDGRHITLEHFP